MSHKSHIEVVSDYRAPENNEFFFRGDPRMMSGISDLLKFLEDEGYTIEHIPTWRIKSKIENDFSTCHGIKVVK